MPKGDGLVRVKSTGKILKVKERPKFRPLDRKKKPGGANRHV